MTASLTSANRTVCKQSLQAGPGVVSLGDVARAINDPATKKAILRHCRGGRVQLLAGIDDVVGRGAVAAMAPTCAAWGRQA